MRTPIASVPPLLADIRSDVGLSGTGADLMVTLPVLCFGLGAPLTPALVRRFGEPGALAGCVALVAIGCAMRLYGNAGLLLLSTIVVSLPIAVAGAFLPGAVKRISPRRAGGLMGVYTTLMLVGAAIASAAAVPIAQHEGSVRVALAVWALPALAGAGLLAACRGRAPRTADAVAAGAPLAPRWIWRDRVAWEVTGFLACDCCAFYSVLAWLPTVERAHGASATSAGIALSVFGLAQIPAALVVPMVAERCRAQRGLATAVTLAACIGVAGLVASPTEPMLLWAVALGLGQGGAFGLALALVVLRARDHSSATELSSMAQTVGYALAAAGPFAVGAIHQASGTWTVSLAALGVVLAGQLVVGLAAGRDVHVSMPALRGAG